MRDLLGALVYGVRLDLASAAYLTLVPALVVALGLTATLRKWANTLVRWWMWVTVPFVVLVVTTDLETFSQWAHRLDGMIFTYLRSPREAWASAAPTPWHYLLPLLAALTVAAVWIFQRTVVRAAHAIAPLSFAAAAGALFVAALLIVPARGGIQQIPINQSAAYFSDSPFANQAALNVFWNLGETLLRNNDAEGNPYLGASQVEDLSDSLRAYRGIQTGPTPKLLRVDKPNVLLIVWESGTARAIESLGGLRGITPAFDTLRKHGILFDRVYAAGERTDKGLPALLSGFPQTPRGSIVKSPAKSAALPFLSTSLAGAGYQTSFTYGGELGFANFESYLRNGSFERLTGKSDFPLSTWTTKWGVHDDIVGARLIDELKGAREPFFATWLTLSSHEPFDVPGPKRFAGTERETLFLNSVAFTDSTLGQVLCRAAAEPWWERTLVVIVADHGQRLWKTDRDAMLRHPDAFYHVPMLWLGGALAVRDTTIHSVTSQTDIAPTLLAQLGLDASRFAWGRDVLAPGITHAAYYGFDEGFGVVTDRGAFLYEHPLKRVVWQRGEVSKRDVGFGTSMLGLTYEDFLQKGQDRRGVLSRGLTPR